MTDYSKELVATVEQAHQDKTALYICGGGSKSHILGRSNDATPSVRLELSKHSGIVDYHPGELVMTARAGTTLTQINSALAKEGQVLSFEPPVFGGKATLGGTLACNMSGPARPWGGSVRDMVLGVQLINGKGQLLNFGGQVMKNVAGYDVSRLQAGALGTLGILTQVSLKVLPVPEHRTTLCYEVDAAAAMDMMVATSAQAKPLSGAYWADGVLYLRLSGAENAVIQTAKHWGGEPLADGAAVWQTLREFDHPFFSGDEPLWRFSQNPSAPVPAELGEFLIDWGGAQRWLRGEHDRIALEKVAERAGGHVSLFRGGDRTGEVKHSLPPLEKTLHKRLKYAFDPAGLLNPGRMYTWM